MRNFFQNFLAKFGKFMYGRNGVDGLCNFLTYTGIVLLLLSYIRIFRFLYLLALVCIVLSVWRSLSKNIYKRQAENMKYYNIKRKVTQKFNLVVNIIKYRKTRKYYKCPSCKNIICINHPGSGRTITVTCPVCKNKFDKRT